MTHWAIQDTAGTGHTFCGLEVAVAEGEVEEGEVARCTAPAHRYDFLVFANSGIGVFVPWEAITCDACKAEYVGRQLAYNCDLPGHK